MFSDIIKRGIVEMVKHMVKYILTFLGVVFLLTFMLVISAKIPQTAIKENVRESAEYL